MLGHVPLQREHADRPAPATAQRAARWPLARAGGHGHHSTSVSGFDPSMPAAFRNAITGRGLPWQPFRRHTSVAMTHACRPRRGAWLDDRPPPGSGQVTLLEETSFCISEASGDILPGGAQGLFFRDTRLSAGSSSGWTGELPEPVAVQQLRPVRVHVPEPDAAAARPQADSTLLVIQAAATGQRHARGDHAAQPGARPPPAHPRIASDGDFADLFEVKEGRGRPNGDDGRRRRAGLRLDRVAALPARRQRRRHVGHRHRGPVGHAPAADLAGGRAQRRLLDHVGADHAQSWTARRRRSGTGREEGIERSVPARRLAEWRRRSPLLHTSDERLAAMFATSTEDLGSLRIFEPGHPSRTSRGDRGRARRGS